MKPDDEVIRHVARAGFACHAHHAPLTLTSLLCAVCQDPNLLMHYLKYTDGWEGYMQLSNESLRIVKREEWLTVGHRYIGKEIGIQLGENLDEEKATVIAWCKAGEKAGKKELFKIETDDKDWHVLETDKLEEYLAKRA